MQPPTRYATHQRPAEIVNDYFISKRHGFFYVVMPEPTANIISNPSLETNSTGYSANGGASIERTAAEQYRGAYSLKVTPGAGLNDGAFYGTVALVANTDYTFSIDFLGVAGVKYQIYFANTIAQRLSVARKFTATGRWQRVSVPFREGSINANRRLYFVKEGSTHTGAFYVDGLQVEAKRYATTYADGSLVGYVKNQTAYFWNGLPHASTSQRIAQTASGGRPVKLLDLGFRLLSIIGLGMAPLRNISTPYGLLDGALYQRTITDPRAFTLAGELSDRHLAGVYDKRNALVDAFKPERVSPQQPLLLLYEYADECDQPSGEILELVCHLDGGLTGLTDNRYQERVGLNFTMYEPFLKKQKRESAALAVQENLGVVNNIVQRNADGSWRSLGVGAAAGVTTNVIQTLFGPDGKLYVVGNFAAAGGEANTANIARFNYETNSWESVAAGGADARVGCITFDAEGNMFVGGAFATIGGVAATRAARRDAVTGAWSALGSGLSTEPSECITDNDGTIVFIGGFATAGGLAANGIARWNDTTSTWSIFGTGFNVLATGALEIGADGFLYVGGFFTTANGVSANRIARWNPDTATFEPLGGGLNERVDALKVGIDGLLYVGGRFSTAGGVAARGVAYWNGQSWSPVGNIATGFGFDLAIDEFGNIYDTEIATTDSVSFANEIAMWNGSEWVFIDVDDSFASVGLNMVVDYDKNRRVLIIGGTTTAETHTAAVTIVDNAGKANSNPVISITNPPTNTVAATVFSVRNWTTNEELYFDLTLNPGETLTIDCERRVIYSNFRANLLSSLFPGSDFATFHLAPGANNLSLFVTVSSGELPTATVQWTEKFHGLR